MKIFGYRIIIKSEKEYQSEENLKNACQQVVLRTSEARRWFSGWTDLNIIWDYIHNKPGVGQIESVRSSYAKARQTDEYGK